jgi:hypothetical protein
MTIATVLFASLVCVCMCAAAQKDAAPVFACNLKTMSSAERLRYDVLVKRIRGAMRDRMETSNGYVFKLDSKTVTLPEAAEWMGMERLCCPLLTLQLAASGNQADWLLTLTGPEGVKSLLDAEFPAR